MLFAVRQLFISEKLLKFPFLSQQNDFAMVTPIRHLFLSLKLIWKCVVHLGINYLKSYFTNSSDRAIESQ